MLSTASDDATAHGRLSELQAQYGLPDGCTLRETFLQRTAVSQLELNMVGLVADAGGGTTVTGAAADELGYPVDRAFFELIERLSVFLARRSSGPLVVRDARGARKAERAAARVFPADPRPEQLRTSLSNGVALHSSWPAACEAALCELIERDRVLRSFAGEFAPLLLPAAEPALAHSLQAEYEVAAYSFGPKRRKLSHLVAGLFLLPRRSSAPLVYGFGAARELDAALASARREALQRLAFLWGEELPAEPPASAPTPDYHQEYYLHPAHHRVLHEWLSGHRRRAIKRKAVSRPLLDAQPVSFVDLSPPGLRAGLAVAKASSSHARVLRFGAPRGASAVPHPIA